MESVFFGGWSLWTAKKPKAAGNGTGGGTFQLCEKARAPSLWWECCFCTGVPIYMHIYRHGVQVVFLFLHRITEMDNKNVFM